MLLWWDYFLRDPGWSLGSVPFVPLSLSTFRSLIFSSISAVFGLVSHHDSYIVCLRWFFTDWDPMGWKSPLNSPPFGRMICGICFMHRFTMTTPHATRRVLGGEYRRRWFWFRCAEKDSMCVDWEVGLRSLAIPAVCDLFGVVKWPLKWWIVTSNWGIKRSRLESPGGFLLCVPGDSSCDLLIPSMGGHPQPLSSGHANSPSRKGAPSELSGVWVSTICCPIICNWAMKNPGYYFSVHFSPIVSMYGIFSYIYHKKSTKCRYIYHTWILWV